MLERDLKVLDVAKQPGVGSRIVAPVVRTAEVDRGLKAGPTTGELAEIKVLRREGLPDRAVHRQPPAGWDKRHSGNTTRVPDFYELSVAWRNQLLAPPSPVTCVVAAVDSFIVLPNIAVPDRPEATRWKLATPTSHRRAATS